MPEQKSEPKPEREPRADVAPTVRVPRRGEIVDYRLASADERAINRRRTTGESIASRGPGWPAGAQAHIGSAVLDGDTLPLLIVKVEKVGNRYVVNGQVALDGNDQLWVTGIALGTGPGTYNWPE